MGFEFGSGFSVGQGFSMKPKPANPLDEVEYTGDLQADSLAELEALRAAMLAAPAEHLLTLVFPDRESLDSFMWRRHLPKAARFIPGAKAVRSMATAQAGAAFSTGGGFSLRAAGSQDVEADAGWLERSKQEKRRFTLATDPEYYVVVHFDTDEARQAALDDLGLQHLTPLPVAGGVFLSGPEVDSVLP